jgi:hypothetical protein
MLATTDGESVSGKNKAGDSYIVAILSSDVGDDTRLYLFPENGRQTQRQKKKPRNQLHQHLSVQIQINKSIHHVIPNVRADLSGL